MRYFISIFGKLNYTLGHLEGCWIDHWFLSLILHSILAFFLSFSSCPLLISCSLSSLLPYFHHFYFPPYILFLPINLSPLPLSSFSFFLLSSSIYIFLLSSYFSLYSPILKKYNRGSFQPRDQTWVSCINRWFFTAEPPGKPKNHINALLVTLLILKSGFYLN